jgi:hypothetical protein
MCCKVFISGLTPLHFLVKCKIYFKLYYLTVPLSFYFLYLHYLLFTDRCYVFFLTSQISNTSRSQNCEKRQLATLFLSVCLSVCSVHASTWNQSALTGRSFIKFESFSKIFREIVSLNSGNNNGYFTWRRKYTDDDNTSSNYS